MNLEAFEFKNGWRPIIVASILQVILFLICFYFYATYFAPNARGFYSTILLFLILSYLLMRAIARNYRFVSLGQLSLIDNQLLQSKTGNKVAVSDFTDLKVKYAGDKYWYSSFKPLMLYKQLFRYDHLYGTSGLNETFDYIEANGKRVYVKIKNESDKRAFIKLVEKLQRLKPDLEKSIK